jgi:hypothetical protein
VCSNGVISLTTLVDGLFLGVNSSPVRSGVVTSLGVLVSANVIELISDPALFEEVHSLGSSLKRKMILLNARPQSEVPKELTDI